MKAKLFAILGLIIAVAGMSLALSSPVEAKGEKYRWIDKDTVEASGGLYKNVNAAKNGVINFTRASGFKITSKGACDITMTIVPSVDNASGTLTTKGCDEPAKDFDRSFTISDVDKGPPVGTNPGTPTTDTGTDSTTKTSCAVSGIGWIVCPVMTFMSKIVDGAYAVVASLLEVQPLYVNGSDVKTKPIYDAWSIMRNIANVAFVIAFLIIIFSQITSVGITNYGIKKMLPRVIIAAILVNISYWICAGAVDLSNILGGSLKSLFDNMGGAFAQPVLDNSSGLDTTSGKGWEGIVGGVLAATLGGAALLYVGLSALLPILIAALLAIVTVFLVLALRQALIILLIVISPLAFVAYLLPNTESLFKKWLGLLQSLLLMYPIIAVIFGVSALASTVIMTTAGSSSSANSADAAMKGLQVIVIQIMGAGVSIIPLALTPIIMKAGGGLLNRFGGIINNPNKGPFDRMKKGAEGYRKNRQTLRQNRALNGGRRLPFYAGSIKSRTRRNAVNASREAGLRDAQTRYVSEQARSNGGDNAFATQMAGGSRVTAANERAKTAVIASALSQEKKAFQEDVSNMEALIKVRFDDPAKALEEAIAKGDRTSAVAAQNILFASGSSGITKFRQAIQESENSTEPNVQAGFSQVSDELRANVKDKHGQYAKQKGADVIKWAGQPRGTKLSDTHASNLSDNDLASQHEGSMKKMVENGDISAEQARRMLGDPRVSANLDNDQKRHLTNAAGGDLRATPSRDELDIAHEEANVQNALHNMNNPPNP